MGSHCVFQQARGGVRKGWVIIPSVWSHQLFSHTTAGQLAFTMGRKPEGGCRFLGGQASWRGTQAQCLVASIGTLPLVD